MTVPPNSAATGRKVRTEVEVAADTVAVLVVRQFIPAHRTAQAAETAGLMAGEVAAAVRRLNRGEWHAPRHTPARDAHPSSASPDPQESPTAPPAPPATITRLVGTCGCGKPITRPAGQRGRDPARCAACRNAQKPPRPGGRATEAYKRTHPAPGLRVCSKCGVPKALGEFNIKDPRTGNVDTYCRPCRHDYAASRYARAGQKVVTVELVATDAAVGALCSRCGHPFEAGQRVQGDHLHHEQCGKSDR